LFVGKKKYEREYWFSVPKERAKNLYHFFQKWAPEIYGDVDDTSGCEERGLEPLNTDDELEDEEIEGDSVARDSTEKTGDNKENDGLKLNTNKTKFWRRRSPMNFLKLVEDHFSTDGMSTDWNVICFFTAILNYFSTLILYRYLIHRKSTASRSDT